MTLFPVAFDRVLGPALLNSTLFFLDFESRTQDEKSLIALPCLRQAGAPSSAPIYNSAILPVQHTPVTHSDTRLRNAAVSPQSVADKDIILAQPHRNHSIVPQGVIGAVGVIELGSGNLNVQSAIVIRAVDINTPAPNNDIQHCDSSHRITQKNS